MPTRRSALLLGTAATASSLLPPLLGAARAELFVDVRRGNFQPIPIAVADFSGDGEFASKIPGIIGGNLSRSGYFSLVERERFPERPTFDWRRT